MNYSVLRKSTDMKQKVGTHDHFFTYLYDFCSVMEPPFFEPVT